MIHSSCGLSQICSSFFGGRRPARPSSAPPPPPLVACPSLGPAREPMASKRAGMGVRRWGAPRGDQAACLEVPQRRCTGPRIKVPLGPRFLPLQHWALGQGREKLPAAAAPLRQALGGSEQGPSLPWVPGPGARPSAATEAGQLAWQAGCGFQAPPGAFCGQEEGPRGPSLHPGRCPAARRPLLQHRSSLTPAQVPASRAAQL